ncbi:hypothetical protein E3N88_03699 [Mikania micrantha]|uniref:Uncharacterized protein n=1 Tax=Mikania micrantha TaxID=192012 RepID=A0A5N6PUJ5_9ASTR|nr:hypothetical protein E3N88_03699 [Mikania micrantha]
MGPIVLTQIATGISVLAGAALLKSVMDQNPMMGPGSGSGQFPRCSSCNGTGRVSCLCNRWSDGDSGCRTCAGSGRMMCNRCGGSGTGRPLPMYNTTTPPIAVLI